MERNHLKLVWDNLNSSEKKIFGRFIDWLCAPRKITLPRLPWQKSQEEKAAILQRVLTNAFGDFDYTTESVNLFPSIRAEQAVREMIETGTLDMYWRKYQVYTKCLKRLSVGNHEALYSNRFLSVFALKKPTSPRGNVVHTKEKEKEQ